MLSSGFGRVLVAVYAIFALAATARSLVQITTDVAAAPLAYALSAVAAVVYIIATYALVREHTTLAWAAILFEFCGVVAVGLWSFAVPERFPEATVWSHLGSGYGYVPLVLPIVGVWWLSRRRVKR